MSVVDFLKSRWNNFSTRIFLILTFFLIVLYLLFSAFFIFHQTKALKTNLVTEGKTITELFAHNCRLGLFAENRDLLKGPFEGIKNHNNIILIQAFTNDFRELLKQYCNNHNEYRNVPGVHISTAELKHIMDTGDESGITRTNEYKEVISFIRPVTSSTAFTGFDIYSRNRSLHKNNVIGFVRVVFTTKDLRDKLNDLTFKGIIIPVFFMIPVWLVIFYTVENTTRPLKNLTRSVSDLGKGKDVKMVEVETDNEIGNLADAFNKMVFSLKKKEDEKRHVEQQLRQSQKMEAVGTLAGGIAHDFNNILSVIAGYASLLKKNSDFNEDSKQYLDNLLSTTEKAASLIKGLLAFTRQQNIVLRPVNINDVAKNFQKNLLRLFRRNIELRLKLSESALIVMSDATQIEQVLLNLSLNAKDAMPEGGVLTISTERATIDSSFITFSGSVPPGRYAVLSVSDTGTGMDRNTMERIFDPFFTTKQAGSGTGLGLSMVYNIVKHHGGFIDVRSTPGRGAEFRIYFSLVDSEVLPAKPRGLNYPSAGTETILLAEDNKEFREITTRVLTEAGYTVIAARNGNEAVKMFIENRDDVDLLLFDVSMPEKDGRTAFEDIKKMLPEIKVLFLSGHTDENVPESSDSGTRFHSEDIPLTIAKPVMPDYLLERIRELLDK